MQSLVTPSVLYRDSFLAGAAEFLAEGRFDSTYARSLGYGSDSLADQFPQFVRDLKGLAARVRYPDRVLWLVHDGEYIGQTSIRPELTTPVFAHLRRAHWLQHPTLAAVPRLRQGHPHSDAGGIAGNWAAPRTGHLRLGQHWFAQDH